MEVQPERKLSGQRGSLSASLTADLFVRVSALVDELKPALLRHLAQKSTCVHVNLWNASRDDHLLLPNCGLAAEFLGERLKEVGIPAQEAICARMPLKCSPWWFRRGEDPFPQSHFVVIIKDERRGDLILLDGTYKQFLTHHVLPPFGTSKSDEQAFTRAALSTLPDVLVCRECDLPEFREKVFKFMISHGATKIPGGFSNPAEVKEYVEAIFNPHNYKPATQKYSAG